MSIFHERCRNLSVYQRRGATKSRVSPGHHKICAPYSGETSKFVKSKGLQTCFETIKKLFRGHKILKLFFTYLETDADNRGTAGTIDREALAVMFLIEVKGVPTEQ